MVLIVGQEAGHADRRAAQTKDGDVVVDVCADASLLDTVASTLETFGYHIPLEAQRDEMVTRCTFVSGHAQIDVLCPDDATAAALDTATGVQSLAIPGGRRALETAEPVEIRYSDRHPDAVVPVPTLEGALAVKIAAVADPRTAAQARHIQDVGFLLAAVDDPDGARTRMSEADVRSLSSLRERLLDDSDVAWEATDDESRRRAQALVRHVLT